MRVMLGGKKQGHVDVGFTSTWGGKLTFFLLEGGGFLKKEG